MSEPEEAGLRSCPDTGSLPLALDSLFLPLHVFITLVSAARLSCLLVNVLATNSRTTSLVVCSGPRRES